MEHQSKYPSKLIGGRRFIGTHGELEAFQERQKLLGEAMEKLIQAGYRDIAEQVNEVRDKDHSRNIQDLMPKFERKTNVRG